MKLCSTLEHILFECCLKCEVIWCQCPTLLFLCSLWHGTVPQCYSGHHVANVEHGQTGQYEVGLLFW